ncbi:lipolytic enzyme [Xylariaceae sp. FL1272]|nr:lipolytic enzyme [Xylariaceae sp. FL1272]
MRPPAPTTLLSTFSCLATAQNQTGSRFLGRVNPATRELSWPASGIALSFTGTYAKVPITAQWGDTSIEMVVDDGAPIVVDHVSGTSIDTPTGLQNGTHTVEIRKKSEAYFGSLYLGEPSTDGTFTALKTPQRKMELIGDSITVGYGLEGVYPCTNAADNEGATLTYGALTAKNLSADYSIVAWSGKGLTRNYVQSTPDTSPLMPELWTRYGPNDADNSYDFSTPVDIVVINLGTNDFSFQDGVRGQLDVVNFTTALVSFANTVHGKYPSATMFILSSPLLDNSTAEMQKAKQQSAIQSAISQLTFTAHFVDIPTQDSSNNNIGCDYHPSALTHQEMAVTLTSAIEDVLG